MKNLLLPLAVLLFLLQAPVALAGSKVPNLLGTWDVKSEGALLIHGSGVGEFTHWTKNQTTLKAVVQVLEQDGRVIRGIFKSDRGSERFAAVIGSDKKLYFVDEDGFLDGRIVNNDTIEIIYRHVGTKDSVVAAGVWTRRK